MYQLQLHHGVSATPLQNAAETVIPAAAQHANKSINRVEILSGPNKTQAGVAAQIRRHTDALRWLCRTAGTAAVAAPSLASQLLRVPEPHTDVVLTLLKEGVRVSVKQLVSGADVHAHSSSTAASHKLVVTCNC
jgi:hypothetical protein